MAGDFFSGIVMPFVDTVFERFLSLVTAPYRYPEMIWIILPVVATLVLMEFYFGRYQKEKLGWNSAVANSIVLIFVSIDLFRQTYQDDFSKILTLNPEADMFLTTAIAGIIGTLGIWLLIVDFFHMIPEKFAYRISAHLPINLTAYVAIILVYTNLSTAADEHSAIPLNPVTLISAIVLFFVLYLIFRLIRLIEPKEDDPKPTEKQKEEEATEELFADV